MFEKAKLFVADAPIPLAPLQKGGTGFKVPLLKGDLGGSWHLQQAVRLDQPSSNRPIDLKI
jgi:hypothetical protein